MKNLQINTSPIGAQEYNFGEKVDEDIYIYGEKKPIVLGGVAFKSNINNKEYFLETMGSSIKWMYGVNELAFPNNNNTDHGKNSPSVASWYPFSMSVSDATSNYRGLKLESEKTYKINIGVGDQINLITDIKSDSIESPTLNIPESSTNLFCLIPKEGSSYTYINGSNIKSISSVELTPFLDFHYLRDITIEDNLKNGFILIINLEIQL